MRASSRRALSLIAAGAAVLVSALCVAEPAKADDVRSQSWQLDYLHIDKAQQISKGEAIVVAVVDTGVNASQPELSGRLLTGIDAGRGMTGNGQQDFDGHGTGMAALIAGHGYGNDGRDGVLGVAPGAKILPISVPGAVVDTEQGLADGISWAIDHGANVISLSVAGVSSDILNDSLSDAIAHDVVVVAGTGNRPYQTDFSYPAKYPGVLAVTATNREGQVPGFAVTGSRTDIAAPGVNIPVPDLNHGYPLAQGTSLSTAIVAGVAALVRAKYPQMSAKEVVHRLEATADDKGAPGKDDTYGYGIVNPVKALTADVPALDPSTGPTAPDEPEGTRHNVGLWVVAGVVMLALLGAGGATAVKIRR